MSLQHYLLSFCFLVLSACGSVKQATHATTKISKITFNSLEASNLSEDRHTLSSQKDETSLFCYLIQKDSILLEHWYKGIFDFTKKDRVHSINKVMTFSDLETTKLVLVLVEHDTNLGPRQMDDIFQSKFSLFHGIRGDFEALQLELGDDDLLDLVILPLREQVVRANHTILFSGVHLFDSYTYKLHCQFD